jgi:hypothetical protein
MRLLIKYAIVSILPTFFLENAGELCFFVLRRKGGMRSFTHTPQNKFSSLHKVTQTIDGKRQNNLT